MQKILIIEDDKGISASLQLYLGNSNFNVFLHDEGLNALDKIAKIGPDLIILDINLPGKNGIKITEELRKSSNIPIIMLTARGSELDRITGLDVGADDYIAKPFSPRELLARINTILRRSHADEIQKDSKILQFEDITIDINKQIVMLGDKIVSLTSKEYDILIKIIEEDGRLVKRETLMKDVIGYEQYLYDRTIDTHIKNLRKKLEKKDMIITVRGEGYRLNK